MVFLALECVWEKKEKGKSVSLDPMKRAKQVPQVCVVPFTANSADERTPVFDFQTEFVSDIVKPREAVTISILLFRQRSKGIPQPKSSNF